MLFRSSDFESRLFLSGTATFFIGDETIECTAGSYIEIEPEVVHAFEYNGGDTLHALRFFSDNEFWKATFI